MHKKSLLFLALAFAFAFASCGGGGSGGDDDGDGTQVTITAAKLVRLDGTELEFSARPIPRRVSIKYTVDPAVTGTTERQEFQDAVLLEDPNGQAVAGSWTWSSDSLSATFTPSSNLEYRTEYSVSIEEGQLPTLSLSKVVDPTTLKFTTLTEKDVNGDGYADAIMGSRFYPGAVPFRGRAYIFHGSDSGITSCDISAGCEANSIITGHNDNVRLATSVAIAGDFNADGYFDVIVGENVGPGSGKTNGTAYIFHGSASGIQSCDLSSGTCSADTTVTGADANSSLGYSVSGAGDVNNDGFDDAIIGAFGATADGSSRGQAYLFHGTAEGIADCDLSLGCTADSSLTAANDQDNFGFSVSSAGDVNGDGFDDVIVGTYNALAGAIRPGKAYVFTGSADGVGDCNLSGTCSNLDATITSVLDGDHLGTSVSLAGDVNGDGYSDIVVGAQKSGLGDKGAAYVILGSSSGIDDCDINTCTPYASIFGKTDNDELGTSVSTAGDVDGDGKSDIIIGVPEDDGAGNNRGEALLFVSSDLAATLTETDASAVIKGEADINSLGSSVSTLGDINGDGFDDIATGSPGAGGTANGRIYVFVGSSSGIANHDLSTESADTTITGANNDQLHFLR